MMLGKASCFPAVRHVFPFRNWPVRGVARASPNPLLTSMKKSLWLYLLQPTFSITSSELEAFSKHGGVETPAMPVNPKTKRDFGKLSTNVCTHEFMLVLCI